MVPAIAVASALRTTGIAVRTATPATKETSREKVRMPIVKGLRVTSFKDKPFLLAANGSKNGGCRPRAGSARASPRFDLFRQGDGQGGMRGLDYPISFPRLFSQLRLGPSCGNAACL